MSVEVRAALLSPRWLERPNDEARFEKDLSAAGNDYLPSVCMALDRGLACFRGEDFLFLDYF